MAVSEPVFYTSAQNKVLTEDVSSWTVYAVLLDESYTPDLAHDTLSDISGDECSDLDYDRLDLTGWGVTGADIVADDLDFGTDVDIGAQFLVLVVGTTGTSAGTDEILCYVQLDGSGNLTSGGGGNFQVNWTDGIVRSLANG